MNQKKRLCLLGITFILLTLAFNVFAYFGSLPDSDPENALYFLTADQKEGFYMMSGVLLLMGVFCINGSRTFSYGNQSG